MPSGKLTSSSVAKELTAKDAALQQAAWWIAGRHPEWGADLARFFRDRLADRKLSAAQADELVSQLSRFSKNASIQDLLTTRLKEAPAIEEKRLVLRGMAGAGLKAAPAAWVEALTAVLTSTDAGLLREAVGTARALPLTAKDKAPEKLSGLLLGI